MISEGLRLSLIASYGEEAVTRALQKVENKIKDGSLKNDRNIENYIRTICENQKREPKERSESYARYFSENAFSELVKRNGPGWFAETMAKINRLPVEKILQIKKQAESNYWYHRVYTETERDITRKEHLLLEKMYQTKGARLNEEEKALYEKVIKMENDIKNKALQESMAVVYEIYFSKDEEL